MCEYIKLFLELVNNSSSFNKDNHNRDSGVDISNFVKNTLLLVVFSTLFSVFGNMMKHCLSCLIHYLSLPRSQSLLNNTSMSENFVFYENPAAINTDLFPKYVCCFTKNQQSPLWGAAVRVALNYFGFLQDPQKNSPKKIFPQNFSANIYSTFNQPQQNNS